MKEVLEEKNQNEEEDKQEDGQENDKQKHNLNIRIFSVVQTASLGAFISGYTGAELFQYEIFQSQIFQVNHPSEIQHSSFFRIGFTLALIFGGIIGSLVFSQMQRYTTKRALMILADIIIILSVAFHFNSWQSFGLQRFMKGVANGINLCSVFVYIREIAGEHKADKAMSLMQININLGIIMATVLSIPLALNNEEASTFWKFLLCFPALPALLRAYTLLFIYDFDTPFSLIQRKKPEIAALMLHQLGILPPCGNTKKDNNIYDSQDEKINLQNEVHKVKLLNDSHFQLEYGKEEQKELKCESRSKTELFLEQNEQQSSNIKEKKSNNSAIDMRFPSSQFQSQQTQNQILSSPKTSSSNHFKDNQLQNERRQSTSSKQKRRNNNKMKQTYEGFYNLSDNNLSQGKNILIKEIKGDQNELSKENDLLYENELYKQTYEKGQESSDNNKNSTEISSLGFNSTLNMLESRLSEEQKAAKGYDETQSISFRSRWIRASIAAGIQQLSGINSIISTSNQSINMTNAPYYQAILCLFLNMFLLFSAIFVYFNIIKLYSNKYLFLICCSISGLCLIAYVFLNTHEAQIIPLLFFYLSFNISLGPLTLIYISYLCKDAGMGRALISYYIGYLISAGLSETNYQYIPLIFSIICFGGSYFFYAHSKLVETSQQTFYHIDQRLFIKSNKK